MPLKAEAALNKDRSNARQADVFQHRHFAVVAGVIATLDPDIRSAVALAFAKSLSDTNRSFDRARFLRACGV